ncbi:PIN domain-containing protein [Massilia sp. R2A-15]|uniref:PIN domain-containing protein n=1 Tax=Massilia sp. R2A-15 TaxID=3064278 RepID=UPI0027353F59|nr:PIN domain-containing protein [Massilia sp. R2A-15]WLI88594.1 PIN domain-containing protein [Massilia sp. R2A-15]
MTAQVIFDTNILIDATKGFKEALDELAHWDDPTISCLTWVELYAGADAADRPTLDAFMKRFDFKVIPINERIMEIAAQLMSDRRRNGPKIALADAIIIATAEVEGLVVITRNTRDFKTNVRVPYQLETQSVITVVNHNPPGESPLPPRKGRPPTITVIR